MFCPNCGKELSENVAFCPECGSALHAAAPTDAAQTAAGADQAAPVSAGAAQTTAGAAQATAGADQAAPVSAGAAQTTAGAAQAAPVSAGAAQATAGDAQTTAAAAKKKKKKGLVVAIVLLLVIAAAAIPGFVLWNNDNFRCWLDVREASKMYESNDYESAVEAYQRALNRVEDSSDAIDGLLRVAKAHYKEENYEEALDIYDLVLEWDSKNQKAMKGQLDCYLAQGETALNKENYDKALDLYKKAHKINKSLDSDEESGKIRDGQLQAYIGLAQKNLTSGEYDKAREYSDYVLADADSSSDLYDRAKTIYAKSTLALGQESFLSGHYAAAETYYREILREETVGSLAYQGLADIYVAWNDVDGAISVLEEGSGYYYDSSLWEKLDSLRNSQQHSVSPYPIMTDAKGNKYDLGGAKVYLYSWYDESKLDTPYWRAVEEYREWAQQEYNFTFEWRGDAGGWGDFQNLGEIAQGTFYWDNYWDKELCMVMLPNSGYSAALSAAEQNLLWDLNSLGVFDFSESRWTQNGVSDLFRKGNSVYACATGTPDPRGGMFFNATLLEDLTGITPDDLYDLQAKNEWTWDKFMEICETIYQKGDLNGDGVQDVYALAGNERLFTNLAMYSNNTSLIRLNGDGKFEYIADSPATLEALEFQREVRRAPYWYNDPDGWGAWDYFYDAFDLQGKFVFLPDETYQMNQDHRLAATDYNNAGEYGFLMFPMGPSAGGKYINCYDDNILVLPKCYNEDEAKTIAAAYEIIFADIIPGYLGYNPRLDYCEANVYHERALNETLVRMMSEGTFIDSGKLLPDLDTSAAFDDTSKSIPEALNAVASQWKAAIDEYNYRH